MVRILSEIVTRSKRDIVTDIGVASLYPLKTTKVDICSPYGELRKMKTAKLQRRTYVAFNMLN